MRPVSRAERADRRARAALAHHAKYRLSRIRHAAGFVGRRITVERSGRKLGIDPVEIRRRNLPAKGEAFIPHDTPADGEWSTALVKAAGGDRLERAPSAESRARYVARAQELLDRIAIHRRSCGSISTAAPPFSAERRIWGRVRARSCCRSPRRSSASHPIASLSSWATRPSSRMTRRRPRADRRYSWATRSSRRATASKRQLRTVASAIPGAREHAGRRAAQSVFRSSSRRDHRRRRSGQRLRARAPARRPRGVLGADVRRLRS